MSTTIADLQVKIGADGSGLKQELSKTQQEVNKAFSINPINAFSNSIDGVSGKISAMIGNFTRIAGMAATGFGLTSIVNGAVQAGESVYQLTQRYQMSNAEAVQMSRIMKITGNDADSAAKSIMRLDKSYTGTGDSSKKAQATLAAYGVSITDTNGKLLPLNQQLENLAKGYQEAAKEGNGQAFVMNTLGARGLALVSTLQNYNEAAQVASKIKGIGLDPAAMHEADLQIKAMDLEFGQLKIAAGAAFAPLLTQILPDLMPMMQESAEWISKNKAEIIDTAADLTKMVVIYESLKAAKKAYQTVSGVVKSVSNSGESAQAVELSKTQQREINKTIAASDRMYDQMRKDAVKTARQQNMSAEETRQYLTQRFTEIGLAATEAAETIRTEMTAKFIQLQTVAAESSAQVSKSVLATGVSATESEAMHVSANEGKIASNEAVISSNTVVGRTAIVAGEQAAEGAVIAEGAIAKEASATVILGRYHESAGTKAVAAGSATISASSKAIGIVKNFTSTVWALAGGWLGVAAAIGYAITKYLDYEDEAKRRNDTQVEHGNGVYLTQDKDGNIIQRERVGGPNSRTTTEWHDASDENKAWFQNNLDYEKNYKELSKGGDDFYKRAMSVDSLKAQFAADGLDANGNTIKETKQKKDNSTAMQSMEFLVGQGFSPIVAAGIVGNLMTESGGGTENIDPNAYNENSGAFGIAQWTDDRKQNLFDFASNNGVSAYDLGTQLAFLAHELKTTEAGSLQNILRENPYDASTAADLVDQYYERSEGTTRGSRESGAQTIFQKYSAGSNADSLAGKILQQQQKIDEAKKSLSDLMLEMQSGIAEISQTTYESSMAKLNEDVKKRSDAIDKIKKVSASIDTKPAEDLLKKYQSVQAGKITDAWRESWRALKTDTAKIDADIYGNYKGMSDAEYQTTIDALNKEYKERLKAVEQSKDDAVAKVAVDKWYNDSLDQALQKRTESYRDAYDKQVQFAINTENTDMLQSLMNPNGEYEEVSQWNAKKKALQEYYTLWKNSQINMTEATAEAAETFAGGLSSIFSGLGTNINSVKSLVESFGNLVINTMLKIVAQAAASRMTEAIFGSLLSGTSSDSSYQRLSKYLPSYSISSGGSSSGTSSLFESIISGLTDYQSMRKITGLATGGVVTSPTLAMIGEGKDTEGVIPYNDHTFSSLARSIVSHMKTNGSSPTINITNNSDASVKLESVKEDDTGNTLFNFTVSNLLSNKDGSLSALKAKLGG